jgi:hypothetical protein
MSIIKQENQDVFTQTIDSSLNSLLSAIGKTFGYFLLGIFLLLVFLGGIYVLLSRRRKRLMDLASANDK